MKELSYLMVLVLTLALTSCTDSPTVPKEQPTKEQPTTVGTRSLENQIVVGDVVLISVSCVGPGNVQSPVYPELGLAVIEVSFDEGPRVDLRCRPMALETVGSVEVFTVEVGGSWHMEIFLLTDEPTCIFEGTTLPLDLLTCTFRDTVFSDPPLSDEVDEAFLNSGVEVRLR